MEPFPSSSDHLMWESRRRRSGIDFDDVFGGPPRRSSLSSRPSAEECADSLYPSGRDAGDALGDPWRWSFGEVHSPSSRRKGLGDGFFSDIFRGGGSGCSTPRRLDCDAQSSTSGSRTLSPVRTLPPRSELVGGGSSVLSPLSVTQKVDKAQGYPAPGSSPGHFPSKAKDSASHAGIHMPSIANGVSASQANMRTAPCHSLHLSHLLFQKFHGEDPSLQTDRSASISSERNVDEDSTNVKDTEGSDHFHFSIYKWAGKGVMLMVPPSPKEKTRNRGRLSGLPVPFLHGVVHPLNKKSLPSGNRVFSSEFERLDTEVHGERKSAAEFTEAINRTKVQTTDAIPLPSDEIAETVGFVGLPVGARLVAPSNEPDKGIPSDDASDAPRIIEKEEIPSLYKLFDLLKDHIGGNDGELEDKIEGSLHQTASVGSANNAGERKQTVKMPTVDESSSDYRQSGYKIPSDSAQGTVKDFIKIFNQDVSSKFMNFVEPRNQSSKAKDMEKSTMLDDGRYVSKLDGEEKFTYSIKDEILPNEPPIKEFVKEENLAFDLSAGVKRIHRCSSVKNEATIPSIESILENVEVLYGKMVEPYFEVEECVQVEEVVFQLQDQDDLPQTASKVEEFQNSDAKIRDWSSGKEGNIRSLLSTLQYVLWPGSGWKVVPLMDLIESSSVRKTYQRALLCLHPDKLQQRGASEHQKYTAEKVFDILQEAWNQFSSVSPI